MSTVSTDKEAIEELLSRGVAELLPSEEEVRRRLASGERLRVYHGADATGPDLHLGHAKQLIFLERLRRLGHEIILLFGDFTALIGDPTDKTSARTRLSRDDVESNIATWREQAGTILSFDDAENPALVRRNSEWLSGLSFEEVTDIASNFTVQHMLERDMFERRMQDGKPIYLHEFFYPLMQGYDSVVLDVDGEVGGTDQTFNMLAGRTLQRIYNDRDKFVITTTLLVDPATGKKLMSKSEGGYISLQDDPADMFGKVMALPDGVITQLFNECTFVSREVVQEIGDRLAGGENPRDVKIELAREIVGQIHGSDAAVAAQQRFEEAFSERRFPNDAPEMVVAPGVVLADALIKDGWIASKSAFRRLVEQGGVADVKRDASVDDPRFKVHDDMDLKLGKKQFIKVRIQES